MSEVYGDYNDTEISDKESWGVQSDGKIHVSDREDGALILKTKEVGLRNLTPDVPSARDPSLVGRVQPMDTDLLLQQLGQYKSDLEEIVEEEEVRLPHFPNVAWEFLKLGLEKERFVNAQINGHVKKAEEIQENIDLLLDLQAALNGLKDNPSNEDHVKDLLNQLKERDIDLWRGTELDEEAIRNLKELSGSEIDQLRSALQIIFTKEIQVLIQIIGAIMDSVKEAIRSVSRSISQILGKTAQR